MIALLQPCEAHQDPLTELGKAISAFRHREYGLEPTFAAAGHDVDLSPDTVHFYGLELHSHRPCRPGHIMVGVSDN